MLFFFFFTQFLLFYNSGVWPIHFVLVFIHHPIWQFCDHWTHAKSTFVLNWWFELCVFCKIFWFHQRILLIPNSTHICSFCVEYSSADDWGLIPQHDWILCLRCFRTNTLSEMSWGKIFENVVLVKIYFFLTWNTPNVSVLFPSALKILIYRFYVEKHIHASQ